MATKRKGPTIKLVASDGASKDGSEREVPPLDGEAAEDILFDCLSDLERRLHPREDFRVEAVRLRARLEQRAAWRAG